MSAFEFVLVSFAILLGFGISAILEGWGHQSRASDRLRPYPLQIASSAFILYFSLQLLWMLWVIRDADWNYPLFLGVASPILAIALAAQVSRIDTSENAAPIRTQYFRTSPIVYSLFSVFPFFVVLISFSSNLRQIVPDPPNLPVVTAVRIGVFLIWASLAWSKSERFHWIGLGVMFTTAIGFVARLGFRLAETMS